MTSYLAFTPWQALSAGLMISGLVVAALFAGKSWGSAARDAATKRRLAWKDARIKSLEAALKREEGAAEAAGDRARSATAQAIASTTTIRQRAAELQGQLEREVCKILAAADHA